ncbi:3-oxoacyl-ACP synthase III family protein [Flavobacterium silvaticum]|uniref:Ketoacyl-ACP synthase III n=1 Tax=Flavobacterium silvaticum TaxID=1852020 RepID=A0A972JIX1_9FLAO|nr:ketoacyl-ACP synthase III [Flavobacterium silvaticum]NMH29505.1 ketoacyl-ACP synthase III [Flavobacterium silvaticum]
MGATISAIEYHFPERAYTNDDLGLEFPDYDFQRFEEKVGIRVRYLAGPNETALDLAIAACEKLFARVERDSIDYVLYCTQSPEYILPTTACILQDKLGLRKNIGAFDFNLGCSGYTYGVSFAKGLIETGQAANVLLVTAETYSKFLHPLDRSNRSIFGDAASATLIQRSEQESIGKFLFGTDGSGYDKLIIRNGGARNPVDFHPEMIVYGTENTYTHNDLYMNGPAILDFTNHKIPGFIQEVLAANGIESGQADQFILHQANAFMLNFIRKRLKVDSDHFYINLADGGNTVSSTIPIALKDYSQNNQNKLENILLVGFGVGLSWCGGLISIDQKL